MRRQYHQCCCSYYFVGIAMVAWLARLATGDAGPGTKMDPVSSGNWFAPSFDSCCAEPVDANDDCCCMPDDNSSGGSIG